MCLFAPSLHRSECVHTHTAVSRVLSSSQPPHTASSLSLARRAYRIVAIAVRVQAQGQLVVRLLNLLGAGVPLHPQYLFVYGGPSASQHPHTPSALAHVSPPLLPCAAVRVHACPAISRPPWRLVCARLGCWRAAKGRITHTVWQVVVPASPCAGPVRAPVVVPRRGREVHRPPSRSCKHSACGGCMRGVVVCAWACGGVSHLVQRAARVGLRRAHVQTAKRMERRRPRS